MPIYKAALRVTTSFAFVLATSLGSTSHAQSASELLDQNSQFYKQLPLMQRVHGRSSVPTFHRFESVPGSPKQVFEENTEFGSLIPDRFRLAHEQKALAIADRVTLKIFSAPTAKKALCFLATGSVAEISHFVGVSAKAALSIKELCGPVTLSQADKRLFDVMRTTVFGGPTHQAPKKYTFVISDSTKPQIEGFTSKSGVTLIVVHKSETDEPHLIRILAHELAMSFDQLSRLSPSSHTQNWEEGFEAVFQRANWHAPLFEHPALIDEKQRTLVNMDEFRCALRDPAIRYGAAAERAFRFEDRIIKELEMSAQSPATALSGDCKIILGRRAIQVSPMTKTLEWEIPWSGFYGSCGVDLLKDANRTQTLVDRIRLVAGTELTFKEGGKKVSLCSLILEPKVGPRRPENLRHGGPRPRVGGWDPE